MKTYKIKKLEIPEQVQRYFQQIFNKTGATFLDKINELIDAHNESLSDKEEECNCCGWDDNRYTHEPGCNLREKPKQEECHCGKDGHALNSVNCPIHGYEIVPKQEESLQFKLDPLEKITRIELNPKQATSLKEKAKMCNDALPEIFKQSQYPIRHWTLGNFDEANKQTTSLKDTIQDLLLDYKHTQYNGKPKYLTCGEVGDRLISLLQSHLLKEVDDKITIEVNPSNEDQREWYRGLGREEAQRKMREDIIKIINNIC